MNKSIQDIRRVCFDSDSNAIMLIERNDEFSKQEKQRCWYSKSEMESMHHKCIEDAARLASDAKRKQSSKGRGLEGMTEEGRQSLEESIFACIDAVIDEQEIQWEDDCDDFDRLAIVSQQVSRYSLNEAIERAIKDEKDARKIYMLGDQQQKLGPPTMPVRRLSTDMVPFFEQSFRSDDEDAGKTHVDFGTCGNVSCKEEGRRLGRQGSIKYLMSAKAA